MAQKRTQKNQKPVLGGWIDKLYELRGNRIALEKQCEAMKGQEQAYQVQILERLQELAITKASGERATFSFKPQPIGTVTDWGLVEKWAIKNDALDLFQRRLHQSAWLDRVEAGQHVEGVERNSILKVNLTKKGAA